MMTIAVDFDGTIVKHAFPEIGEPVPGAIEWLVRFRAAGARLILWTMRSGRFLEEAIEYCADNGVVLFGVNHNPDQMSWTHSPKAYANMYIDDAAVGCPLVEGEDRPWVDWEIVGPEVLRRMAAEGYELDLSPEAVAESVGEAPPVVCRRCSECVGQKHHLMDDGMCKHCGIQAYMCELVIEYGHDDSCLKCSGSGWYFGDDAPVVSEP